MLIFNEKMIRISAAAGAFIILMGSPSGIHAQISDPLKSLMDFAKGLPFEMESPPSVVKSPILDKSTTPSTGAVPQTTPLPVPQPGRQSTQSMNLAPQTSAPQTSQFEVQPSYDCATASNAMFRLICTDSALARKEFEFSQAYQARRFSLTEADYPELRRGVLAFYEEANRACTNVAMPIQEQKKCIVGQFERARTAFVEKTQGSAREEATRNPLEHRLIQQKIQNAGFLPRDSVLDGVYGKGTRDAIRAYQKSIGEPDAPFLTAKAVTNLLGVAASPTERQIADAKKSVDVGDNKGPGAPALRTPQVAPDTKQIPNGAELAKRNAEDDAAPTMVVALSEKTPLRDLLKGDPNDLILLLDLRHKNVKSGGVILGLDGKIVANQYLTLAMSQKSSNLEDSEKKKGAKLSVALRQMLDEVGVTNYAKVGLSIRNLLESPRAELLIFTVADLVEVPIDGDPGLVEPFGNLLKSDGIEFLGAITAQKLAEIEAVAAAEEARRRETEERLKKAGAEVAEIVRVGTPEKYILLLRPGSANSDKFCALDGALGNLGLRLATVFPLAPESWFKTAVVDPVENSIFIKLRQGACNVFLGRTSEVSKLAAGLRRNATEFSFHHETGSVDQIASLLVDQKSASVTFMPSLSITSTMSTSNPHLNSQRDPVNSPTSVIAPTVPSWTALSSSLIKELNSIESADSANILPSGLLAETFNLLSSSTNVQRENLEKQIKTQIIQWGMVVYEVRRLDEDKKKYRVSTSAEQHKVVGTSITIYARNDMEKSLIESLKTGDTIKIKGKITGTSMRSIEIEPALLVR